VPADIVFTTGASVKVIAGIQDVADAIASNRGTVDTARFAGFRGDESVAGERVIVNVGAIAYVTEIPAP
jgi:hypothetical protein